MKKFLLTAMLSSMVLLLFGQETAYWRSEAGNDNWANTDDSDINNWWHGWYVRRPDLAAGQWSADGAKSFNIIIFNNAHQLTTVVNGSIGGEKYHVHRLELRNSSNRTFNSSDGGYFAMGGGDANSKIEAIEGEGTGTYTFNVPITYEKDTELNPVAGNLIFNSLIDNDEFWTDVWGSSDKTLTISGGLSGTGGLTVKNNTNVIITTDASYTGATFIDAGTLELQGSLASSEITVQNGATLRISNGNSKSYVIEINDLTVEPGGKVEIEPGARLTVNGDLDIQEDSSKSDGELIIKSDATGTGSLIHSSAGVAATVERYMPGIAQTWHLISSPVVADIEQSSFKPGSDDDFYAWHEPAPGTWVNYKNTDEEPTFIGVNGSTNFFPGRGYLVAFNEADPTKSFVGVLNEGNIDIPMTRSAAKWSYEPGWNLVGNPYASAISVDGLDKENLVALADKYVQVWDATAGGGGDYIQPDIIAPHQGFFVRSSGDVNLSFNHDLQVHGGTFVKEESFDSETLHLMISFGDYYSQTRIKLHPDAQMEYDRNDASKLFSFNPDMPQIYTYTTDNVRVAINSIPEIGDETVFPVGMRIPAEGEYTLSLQELTGVFASESIYLTDLKLNKEMLLDANNPYTFTASPEDDPIRFKLHFSTMDDPTNIEDVDAPSVKLWYSNNTLFVNSHEQNTALEVYDISGRRLQSHQLNAGEHRLDLNLPAGVYIVQSSGNSHNETMKIIIQ